MKAAWHRVKEARPHLHRRSKSKSPHPGDPNDPADFDAFVHVHRPHDRADTDNASQYSADSRFSTSGSVSGSAVTETTPTAKFKPLADIHVSRPQSERDLRPSRKNSGAASVRTTASSNYLTPTWPEDNPSPGHHQQHHHPRAHSPLPAPPPSSSSAQDSTTSVRALPARPVGPSPPLHYSSSSASASTARTPAANPRPSTHTHTQRHPSPMQTSPADDEAKIAQVREMMGDAFDPAVARRVLRKHDGDVSKAIMAILDGDTGLDHASAAPPAAPAPVPPSASASAAAAAAASSSSSSAPSGSSSGMARSNSFAYNPACAHSHSQAAGQAHPGVPTRPNTPINIDLTADDDAELNRALKASLESMDPPPPHFGPSSRAPDPAWAVVPSNSAVTDPAQDELSRAIEASLEHADVKDVYEPWPEERQMREDGAPVALRPSNGPLVYAALILQGLYYVPQLRERVARWRPSAPPHVMETPPPTDGPEHALWTLVEIFVHMEYICLSEVNINEAAAAFDIRPWSSLAEDVGTLSHRFYDRLTALMERLFNEQDRRDEKSTPSPNLLRFEFGTHSSSPAEITQSAAIVRVEVGSTAGHSAADGSDGGHEEERNDLLSCLTAQLTSKFDDEARQEVIFAPSDVVAFQLARDPASSSSTSASAAKTGNGGSGAGAGGGSGAAAGGSGSAGGEWRQQRRERTPFRYPKHVYLDPFLSENIELANEKRKLQRAMREEIARLEARRRSLVGFKDKDTLKDLRATIHYYEHVADASGDSERAAALRSTTAKLKNALAAIESEVSGITERIAQFRKEAEEVFDIPELQRARYDLRAVFVHEGLYGRRHLYSCVHDHETDQWWRNEDSQAYRVAEATVLDDPAGLHLGAGPYMLLYSRALPEKKKEKEAGAKEELPWPEDVKGIILRNNERMRKAAQEKEVSGGASAGLSTKEEKGTLAVSMLSTPARSMAPTPSEYTIGSSDVEPALSDREMDVGK